MLQQLALLSPFLALGLCCIQPLRLFSYSSTSPSAANAPLHLSTTKVATGNRIRLRQPMLCLPQGPETTRDRRVNYPKH
mgnify:CR=1 FL=1